MFCRGKITITVGREPFDLTKTPLGNKQKVAGLVLRFPRPTGLFFLLAFRMRIGLLKAILAMFLALRRRRELPEGQFMLENEGTENVFRAGDQLMWRGRKLMAVGMTDSTEISQHYFDTGTNVSR